MQKMAGKRYCRDTMQKYLAYYAPKKDSKITRRSL